MCNVTLRSVRVTIVAVTSITYSECVLVALVIQHAMDMCRIILCGSAVLFQYYLRKGTIFGQSLFSIKCVFSLFVQRLSGNISCSTNKWARCDQKMYIGLHVKYPLFLSDFNETWIIATDYRKIPEYHFFLILYYDQQMHNYYTNYHTPTCFDTIISSRGL